MTQFIPTVTFHDDDLPDIFRIDQSPTSHCTDGLKGARQYRNASSIMPAHDLARLIATDPLQAVKVDLRARGNLQAVEAAVAQEGLAYLFCAPALRANRHLLESAIMTFPRAIWAAPESLRNDDGIQQAALEREFYVHFGITLTDSTLRWVEGLNPVLAFHMDARARADRNCVLGTIGVATGALLSIVCMDPMSDADAPAWVFSLLPDGLKTDPEIRSAILLRAAGINGAVANLAKKVGLNDVDDRDLVLDLICTQAANIKREKRFCAQDSPLRLANRRLRNDPDVVLAAVKGHPHGIKYASALLRADLGIQANVLDPAKAGFKVRRA